MRRRLVITDLTRMQGERVCVAGYLVDGEEVGGCVRPEFRFRPLVEGWLFARGAVVVQPFAIVELDLLEHRPHPPHSEDWIVDERYRVRRGLLTPEQRLDLLERIDDGSVEGIFGAPVHEERGWFVRRGEGVRSLGTVRPASVLGVTYAPKPQWGKWDYRLAFADATGRAFNLAVTDLAYRYYLDHLRDVEELTPQQVSRQMLATLREADRLYLRVGLARGWGDQPERCHLQINGVYPFPDYLDGRCFADFSPAAQTEIDLSDVPF
jgi:hypothetical protein